MFEVVIGNSVIYKCKYVLHRYLTIYIMHFNYEPYPESKCSDFVVSYFLSLPSKCDSYNGLER